METNPGKAQQAADEQGSDARLASYLTAADEDQAEQLLGVLLWEMLLGRPPFVHESVFRLLEMHQQAPLPDAAGLARTLAPELWQVLCRLLEKEPERRYASAQELLVELHRLLARTPALTSG